MKLLTAWSMMFGVVAGGLLGVGLMVYGFCRALTLLGPILGWATAPVGVCVAVAAVMASMYTLDVARGKA